MAAPVWYLNHRTALDLALDQVVLVDPVSRHKADVGRLFERRSLGKPIWKHHFIRHYPAGRSKLFTSETAMQIAPDASRIHGGYGYSTEFDVEQYFRDAPLMIVGQLVSRGTVAP